MLNRRLIRSKEFQALYAFTRTEDPSMKQALSYLRDSLEGVEKNFMVFLHFPVEFAEYVRREKDPSENKYLLKDNDMEVYEALKLTGLFEELLIHPVIGKYAEKPYLIWREEDVLLKNIYKDIQEQEFFKAYLSSDKSRDEQLEFLKSFYRYLAFDNESFDQRMEEFEMHWEDERHPIANAVKKMLENPENKEALKLPSLSKNRSEDLEFAEALFKKTLEHQTEYEDLVDANTPGWDKDRIAVADLLLMVMAITELINFPHIPVKVTLNEYLELAKIYSTPQSSRFLNGILDNITGILRKDERIVKKGRGLIE